MATIPFSKIKIVKDLYYKKLLPMEKVSKEMDVSMDALVYFMRKYDLKRRGVSENEKIKFDRKPLSFKKRTLTTSHLRELSAMGAMLYWAEGYKGSGSNQTVDFANSDPSMIKIFIKFLRFVYRPDEKRFRIYLYCYANQNIKKLMSFWSIVTRVPKNQFSKPYIRSDFRKNGRKMEYGMIHVRYHDKKLLLDLKNMIECHVSKYA